MAIPNLLFAASALLGFPVNLVAVSTTLGSSYWNWLPTPPMSWNSYNAWGTSLTVEETPANARYIIAARCYDSVSPYDDRNFTGERAGVKLFADEFGRLLPATNRFPSAGDGKGLEPPAAQTHAMGLKFDIHKMRG